MSRRPLAVLLLLAAAPAPAAVMVSELRVGESVAPLLEQFPPQREGQNQGAIGDCHDFATVALFEAAFWRAYGHQHRTLSPTDLFVHNTLGTPDAESRYIDRGAGRGPLVEEGGNIIADGRYAKEHGIATERSMPYASFLTAYLHGVPAIKNDIQETERAEFARLISESSLVGPPDPRKMREDVAAGVLRPALRDIMESADRDNPQAGASRAQSKELFARFHLSVLETQRERLPREQCLERGLDRLDFLVRNLRKHRPVGVGMDIGGLWDTGRPGRPAGSPTPSGHAFVIVGYEVRDGQRVVFKTLNTWGRDKLNDEPEDRFVFGEDLCRINRMAAVLTDTETDP